MQNQRNGMKRSGSLINELTKFRQMKSKMAPAESHPDSNSNYYLCKSMLFSERNELSLILALCQ